MDSNEEVRGLFLNVYEVVHLVDGIDPPDPVSHHIELRGTTKYLDPDSSWQDLLYRLGFLYCELVPSDGSFYDGCESDYREVLVSERDLWLLKSRIKTGDMSMDGTVNIGVGLLKKIFKLLREFQFPDLGIPDSREAQTWLDPNHDRFFTISDRRHLRDPATWELLQDGDKTPDDKPKKES